MSGARLPLEGITVVEVASGAFVPATGALLADWGADVIKVDGVSQPGTDPRDALWLQLNRGKRSVVVDPRTTGGGDVLARLIARADVVLTDLTKDAAADLALDVEQVWSRNPNAIYARGSSRGPRGPERDRTGSDPTAYWARGGLATTFQLVDTSLKEPAQEPFEGFGEIPTAGVLAGGVAAAVYRRSISGEATVVDASLLGHAAFNLSMDVAMVAAGVGTMTGTVAIPSDRYNVVNPLTNFFRTKDGRFITLCVMQENLAPQVCIDLGREDLNEDERFATADARRQHCPDFVRALDEAFATRTLAEWQDALADTQWVWETVQTLDELMADPQAIANEYLRVLDDDSPVSVSGPVQFDEGPPPLRRPPAPGEHTDALLAELGLGTDEVAELHRAGAVT
jgi:crotonobetainyl-CoA:carnitine CoA-transferase CaiB-like acyl-CoA transferase